VVILWVQTTFFTIAMSVVKLATTMFQIVPLVSLNIIISKMVHANHSPSVDLVTIMIHCLVIARLVLMIVSIAQMIIVVLVVIHIISWMVANVHIFLIVNN
jgi:hypothetical protein